jgi:lactoylglutathione lyase
MIAIERTGIILHSERYNACLQFYRDKVGLIVEFEKSEPGQVLAIFTFGGSYLMLETGGMARDGAKTASENPITIRFNVTDVEAEAARLRARGVDIQVMRMPWGTIGGFRDPDGNRCELREQKSFGM